MTEHEFSLLDDVSWVVQAFEFSDADQAKVVWEKIEEESRGKQQNFSIWRTTNSERTLWLIVICARREHLPVVTGGVPYELTREEAHQFALRRARVGKDALDKGEEGHLSQEMRYDEGMTIDPATGRAVPYRRQ